MDSILKLLSAPNVRQLAKDFKIKAKGTQKADIAAAIVKHSKQKSMFFVKRKTEQIDSGKSSLAKIVEKK